MQAVTADDCWSDVAPFPMHGVMRRRDFQIERVKRCIADMCLQIRTLPLQLREKVWLARVSFKGFHIFLHVHVLFGLFCFLVSCNLEVLNCGVVAFDLS